MIPQGSHFRWHAVAGQWAPLVWDTTTPRDYGPCGTGVDRNSTLLFSRPDRYYPQFAGVQPLLVEGLLVPFHADGQAVGTVWVATQDETRKFDNEDQRMLESLATVAAAAYQVRLPNRRLQTQIAERQRVEEALRDADRRKSEFLAMLAHELRREPVELASVVHHAVEAARPAMDHAQHQLIVALSKGPVYVDADPARLAEVVGNLLNNACKFTPNGGRIWLTAIIKAESAIRSTHWACFTPRQECIAAALCARSVGRIV